MYAKLADRLETWHEIEGDPPETLCGHRVPADAVVDVALRWSEKSCEECLRVRRHREERLDRYVGSERETPELDDGT